MALTDLITICLSMFFWVRGSSCGFVNSLINPFSIIVATYLSIIYYKATQNVGISLAIGMLGPILLGFFLKILLRVWSRATDTDIKPNFLSRLGGSIVSLIWAWVFIAFTLILLAMLPSMWGKTWADVRNDVTKSVSYNRIAQPLEKKLIANLAANDPTLSKNVSTILSAGSKQNVPAATGTTSNPDVQSLAQDPRFQKILQDPDVQKDINAHDYVKLMSNPKVMQLTQQIMSDPATLRKVMSIYGSQMKPQASAKDSSQQQTQNP